MVGRVLVVVNNYGDNVIFVKICCCFFERNVVIYVLVFNYILVGYIISFDFLIVVVNY